MKPGPYPATLLPGNDIIRFGGEGGTYVGLPGATPGGTSLPPNNPGWDEGYSTYTIRRPIDVSVGIAAPHKFIGGGPNKIGIGGDFQIKLPVSISELLEGDDPHLVRK
jgi:hypothetical protein